MLHLRPCNPALLASAMTSRGGTAKIDNLGTVFLSGHRASICQDQRQLGCNFDLWHDDSNASGAIAPRRRNIASVI